MRFRFPSWLKVHLGQFSRKDPVVWSIDRQSSDSPRETKTRSKQTKDRKWIQTPEIKVCSLFLLLLCSSCNRRCLTRFSMSGALGAEDLFFWLSEARDFTRFLTTENKEKLDKVTTDSSIEIQISQLSKRIRITFVRCLKVPMIHDAPHPNDNTPILQPYLFAGGPAVASSASPATLLAGADADATSASLSSSGDVMNSRRSSRSRLQ